METFVRTYFPYTSLVEEKENGLFRKLPKERLHHHPVVCWTTEPQHGIIERRYGAFESVRSLWNIYERVAVRTGYEVILGCFPQKPHFDVDINTVSVDGDMVIELLIDAIQRVLNEKGVYITLANDVLVYTSHGTDKRSYHVILPNHCHASNTQAKAFADIVRSALPVNARVYVDGAVYNPLQQFRLLGSTKAGKNRVKVEQTVWYYHGSRIETPTLEPLHAFARSLVGWTPDCTSLPTWDTPEPSFVPRSVMSDEAEEALALLSEDPVLRTCRFKAGTRGTVISLKRLAPGHCPVCNRTHDHDNAYLFVRNRSVYYGCHRARASNLKNTHVCLGRLKE